MPAPACEVGRVGGGEQRGIDVERCAVVTFLPNYLILSHYLTAYHWDCLSFILSPIPSTVRALYHPVTCLSGLVIFYLVRRRSITITATTSISGTTTGTLSISGFPSTTTSSIRLALCTI
jgi:hypothetical protein